jgi:uncharacterized protein
MNRFLLIIMLLLFPSSHLFADGSHVYTVDNLPKTHLQNKMLYVSDPEHILSQEATDSINQVLFSLEAKTGIQTVVAMAPSIGGADSFNFALDLLRKWGVGQKKKSNGLVILYVGDAHQIQFGTGYGLEGVLPDAICKRIQQKIMLPYFRRGDINQGMFEGVKVTAKILDGSMKNDDIGGNDGNTFYVILFVIIGVAVIVIVAASRKNPGGGSGTSGTNSRNQSPFGGIFWGEGFGDGGGSGDGGGFSGGDFGGGSGGGGGAGSGW